LLWIGLARAVSEWYPKGILKLTRLIQFGLVTSTTLALSGGLSSCTGGDDSHAAEPTAGGVAAGTGAGAQAGAAAGSLAGGGRSAVGQGGAGSSSVTGTAGNSSVTGGAAGSSSGGGGAAQGGVSTSGGSSASGGTAASNGGSVATSGNAGTSSGGLAGSGGSGNVAGTSAGGFGGGGGAPPVIQGGTPGWASRYWDCCKPACGWKDNVPGGSTPVHSCNEANQSLGADYGQANACDGNPAAAYMCGNFGPWAVSDTLAYGFAAVKMGSDYCGKCYQIQFTGSSHTAANDPGSQSLQGKTMIVQAINTGGVDGTQFDLLIPGGGVGDKNACSTQWSGVELGEQYGGFYLACQKAHNFDYASSKSCAAQKCQSAFANKPDFLAGCNFFVNWLGAPDNPNLVFKETTCPAAITQLSGLKR